MKVAHMLWFLLLGVYESIAWLPPSITPMRLFDRCLVWRAPTPTPPPPKPPLDPLPAYESLPAYPATSNKRPPSYYFNGSVNNNNEPPPRVPFDTLDPVSEVFVEAKMTDQWMMYAFASFINADQLITVYHEGYVKAELRRIRFSELDPDTTLPIIRHWSEDAFEVLQVDPEAVKSFKIVPVYLHRSMYGTYTTVMMENAPGEAHQYIVSGTATKTGMTGLGAIVIVYKRQVNDTYWLGKALTTLKKDVVGMYGTTFVNKTKETLHFYLVDYKMFQDLNLMTRQLYN